ALHPGRGQHRNQVRTRRTGDGTVGQRQRLRHSRQPPAAPDRTFLSRVHQPLAGIGRHRPGVGDRQARAEPAPCAAGDRQRSRPRQHLLLPFRRRADPAARHRPFRSHPLNRPGEPAPRRARARGHGTPAPDPAPAADAGENDPLRDPALYFNRELSQLDFNFRVLAQALDESVPLLERLRYLCISCTNLDEFFEIRAATVRHAQDFGSVPTPPDGLAPATVLKRIHDRAAELVEAQYSCWNQVLRPALTERGVRVLGRSQWNARQTRWLRAYFRDEIMPVLSPLGLDPAHPFPKILNKSLNIVVVLKGR